MGMKICFHDDKPAGPGEAHGPDGPTHCGSAEVDYEYQIEMWVQDVEVDWPHVVRLVSHDLRREWKRDTTGKMQEIPYVPTVVN